MAAADAGQIDSRYHLPLIIATFTYSGALLASVLWLELRVDWNLSAFAQSVILLVTKHAVDNVGSMYNFYWGSSWGSAMKTMVLSKVGAVQIPTDTSSQVKAEVTPAETKP